MKKNVGFIFLFVLIILGYLFLKKSKITKLKLTKKGQPEYCFCSDVNQEPFTICFDSKANKFAAWQSKYSPSLLSLKFPFNYGSWKYGENEIIQTFSKGNLSNVVPLNDHYPFPPFILVGGSTLNPENCQKNIDVINYGIYCPLNSKDPSMLLNFKKKTYKSWADSLLRFNESIFFEVPSFEGTFDIKNDEIFFSTSEIKRDATVLSWETKNVIPKKIQFDGVANKKVIFEKDNCLWSGNSIETIPILNKGKVFCEKTANDLIIWLKPDKTIDFYRETTDFSPIDFQEEKNFRQGTEVELGEQDISYYFDKDKITGKIKMEKGEIVWINFPKQQNMERDYEYSQDFCPPFFLTKNLSRK